MNNFKSTTILASHTLSPHGHNLQVQKVEIGILGEINDHLYSHRITAHKSKLA